MKKSAIIVLLITGFASCDKQSKETQDETNVKKVATEKHLFMDVHNLEPGKVTFEGVAAAHQKDLLAQGKYGVSFIKYWVDEKQGKVYCLAEASDSASIYHTHKEAHGLVPDLVKQVTDGMEAIIGNPHSLYFDIHYLGAGKVKKEDVAKAHEKDLATQKEFGVNFINYWVDENSGMVVCLSEAKNPQAIIDTHTKTHGLVPDQVHKVDQGN